MEDKNVVSTVYQWHGEGKSMQNQLKDVFQEVLQTAHVLFPECRRTIQNVSITIENKQHCSSDVSHIEFTAVCWTFKIAASHQNHSQLKWNTGVSG